MNTIGDHLQFYRKEENLILPPIFCNWLITSQNLYVFFKAKEGKTIIPAAGYSDFIQPFVEATQSLSASSFNRILPVKCCE